MKVIVLLLFTLIFSFILNEKINSEIKAARLILTKDGLEGGIRESLPAALKMLENT